MWWKNIFGSRWTLIGGILFTVPAVFDTFAFWRNTVGELNAGWQGALIAIGVYTTLLWLLNVVERHRKFIRANWENWLEAVLPLLPRVLILSVVAVFIYYTVWVYESPDWTHSTLNEAEQERAIADCELAALSVSRLDRGEYLLACKRAKGFTLIEPRKDE